MRRACHVLLLASLLGCGAKTGLRVPEFDAGVDGGLDGGVDGGFDGGVDAGELECEDRRLVLNRRRAEVYFAIDSSGSMLETFEGVNAEEVEDSRWYLLREALAAVLEDEDDDLRSGALFFPDAEPGGADGCFLEAGLDVPVRDRNADAIIAEFDIRGVPFGGTPTAQGLLQIRDALLAAGPSETARFVVLATDGAPNCNADPPVPPPMCFCTHPNPEVCARARPQNCLDDTATIDALEELVGLDVPVYVLGLTDPEAAPLLGEVLDRMAVAGGRPRPTGERRFYDIRSSEELGATMREITDSVSRCVLYLAPGSTIRDDDTLILSGREFPRDETHTNGWDLTDPEAGEVTLYGEACELVSDGAVLQACVFR